LSDEKKLINKAIKDKKIMPNKPSSIVLLLNFKKVKLMARPEKIKIKTDKKQNI
tara:strand:+ start:123 stop:284 length:162 start_codon:yes stop_codon:yes gene_type:complete